jgi:3',5'-cyclic AMP phosphodiesterase CpdA
MIRLAHLSDIHITTSPLGWKWQDWFSKRYLGWLNFRWLGRRYRFRQGDEVLAALVADVRERKPDRLVFSGDATALGYETELKRAVALLGLTDSHVIPGLAVPGNHDYYTRAVQASGLFERYFAPWQTGIRVDDAIYPFAQQVGPAWLVGVNSCTGNRWPWDAGGSVGAPQMSRLKSLLGRLAPGPRILVTHYPVYLASGKREWPTHGLRDLPELIDVAVQGGVSVWLHGHRHAPYYHAPTATVPFPVICVGSATQHGRWTYGEYTIDGRTFRAVRRFFDEEASRFKDGESFELELKVEGLV